MNPVNFFPKTLGRIVAEPVIDFIEEIEGDVDASKVFFEAQEKAEQSNKNYDNFKENSTQFHDLSGLFLILSHVIFGL